MTHVIEYLEKLPCVFTAEDAAAVLKTHYKAPLKALEAMERRGILLRMKRGRYAVAHSFDPLRAANLILSPSYISFETALSFLPRHQNLWVNSGVGKSPSVWYSAT